MVARSAAERCPLGTVPRAPQRRRQSLLLLVPTGLFGLRFLLERLDLGPDGRRPVRVLRSPLVQCGLRLVDGLLAALALLLPAASSFACSRSRLFRSRS